jgi:hypothetical protein
VPRIKTDEERAADPAPEHAPRQMRPRRPAPDGVTLGLLDSPTPVERPPASASGTGRRGRATSQATVDAIARMTNEPGQWFLLGTFQTNAKPTKESAFGKAGIEFSHDRRPDGCWDRYGRFPTPEPEAVPAENASLAPQVGVN